MNMIFKYLFWGTELTTPFGPNLMKPIGDILLIFPHDIVFHQYQYQNWFRICATEFDANNSFADIIQGIS